MSVLIFRICAKQQIQQLKKKKIKFQGGLETYKKEEELKEK